jgi:hypothetical protein
LHSPIEGRFAFPRIPEWIRPGAITDAHELSIPVFGRQPDFDIDVRIGGGRKNHLSAAVSGQCRCGGDRPALVIVVSGNESI